MRAVFVNLRMRTEHKGELMDRSVRVLLSMSSLSLALFCACGGAQVALEEPTETLSLDAVLIVERDGEAVTVEPDELFAEAQADLAAERYAECAAKFDMLWESLGPSSYYVPSLYNAGLCHEREERWQDAGARYERIIQADGESGDGLDAMFRLAEVDANLSNWTRVANHMDAVLERDGLRHLDKMEALYRGGMALLARVELAEAEERFKRAIRINRVAERAKLPAANHFVAGCYYGRAAVFHLMMSGIKFRLPPERMKADMKEKIALGRQAYDLYVKTVRQKNRYWTVLSGYMVGKLMEDFYYDVLTSEIPHDLTDEEMIAYFIDLRTELRPLLEDALIAYQKTSTTGERINFRGEWLEEADSRMDWLRQYIDDEEVMRSEEAAIIAWNKRMAEVSALRESEAVGHFVYPRPPEMPTPKAALPQ